MAARDKVRKLVIVQLLQQASRVGRAVTKNLVIRNYREHCTAEPSRRALLSYLIHPLLPPGRLRDRVLFSPFGIAQEIPRALNEIGYSVDLVNFNNTRWQPQRDYDLFIGHAALNFERLAKAMTSNTRKIYFATGLYWRDSNRREAERLYDLAMRTGWLLPPKRNILIDEDSANSLADGIIHLGNAHAAETYASFRNVYGIKNSFYPMTRNGWNTKDYESGRKHFLFYAGPGNVHKGLDRLLEAFSNLPLHLHVCQQIEPAFEKAFWPLLHGLPNVHVYGFILQRSRQFYELVQRCNWVVSATCGEGQPGAVIEMMAHGLIPILPDSANIDLGAWGIALPDCSAAHIAETCAAAAELSGSTCRSMAEGVIAETAAHYSIERFRHNFQSAVRAIADRPPNQAVVQPQVAVNQ